MKTERNILIAFILNLTFSVLEFFGGLLTHSVAILSDSLHDLGDAVSIGISYFLEKKSRRQPDAVYTYGYTRFSVLGGLITTVILLVGSILVIIGAVERLFAPVAIAYDNMILFAVIGVVLNTVAAFVTREGDSLNQRAVNLHMLEDVLGWIVVLVGAVVMRFTDFALLDPLMSIGVAIFILVSAVKNLKEVLDIFLEKSPLDTEELRTHLMEIDGVEDVHHIHLRSLDGQHSYATLHMVTNADPETVKAAVRAELAEHGVSHSVIETETVACAERDCALAEPAVHHHHHH